MFGMVARCACQRTQATSLDGLRMGIVVGRAIDAGWSKDHCSGAVCICSLLVMVLAVGMLAVCSSPTYAEDKVARTPISVAELQEKFAASERDKQPVIIENRIIEDTRMTGHCRPHSSLGYRPPAPEAFFKTFIVHNMPEMISCPIEVHTQKTLT